MKEGMDIDDRREEWKRQGLTLAIYSALPTLRCLTALHVPAAIPLFRGVHALIEAALPIDPKQASELIPCSFSFSSGADVGISFVVEQDGGSAVGVGSGGVRRGEGG